MTRPPLPTMTVDAVRYDAMLARGLARFPERRANLEKIQRKERGEVLDHLPHKVYLEILGRCNFQCIMCDLQGLPGRKRGEDITLAQAKALIDALPTLIEVKVPVMGETLLHKHAIEIITYLAERDVWVHCVTNASLLDKQDNHKRLVESGVGELTMSLDGASKQAFETVRAGSKFEKVVANMALTNRYADQVGLHLTRSFTTVQRDNRAEMEAIVRLSAELGFKRHSFSIGLFDWGNPTMAETVARLNDIAPVTLDEGWALVELGRSLGVEVTYIGFGHGYTRDNICPYPFERTLLSSNGRLGACCHISPNAHDLGSRDDILADWNGPAYREFRRGHLSGDIPAACRFCYQLD